jgi:hypothetical protein
MRAAIPLLLAAAGCVGTVETRPGYSGNAPSSTYHTGRFHESWVTLADHFSAQTDRQFINLRGNGGEFTRLRVEAVGGAPVIQQVAIEYANGTTQKVPVNARLPDGEAQVIDVNGAPINRIVVYADPRFGGAYSVFGT